MNNKQPKMINPQEAFAQAIASNILSANQANLNYFGGFMYMYTKDGVHYFKNIITRKYGFDYKTIIETTKLN